MATLYILRKLVLQIVRPDSSLTERSGMDLESIHARLVVSNSILRFHARNVGFEREFTGKIPIVRRFGWMNSFQLDGFFITPNGSSVSL